MPGAPTPNLEPVPDRVGFQDILDARARIQSHIHPTRIARNEQINRQFSAEIFFKCEHEQAAQWLIAQTGGTLIHPYDDPRVIAPLAALLENHPNLKNRRIGIILSGRNYHPPIQNPEPVTLFGIPPSPLF